MEDKLIQKTPSVEEVDLTGEQVATPGRSVLAVVELGLNDLVALEQLRGREARKGGVRPSRSQVIRQAIQFYFERHQEVII